MQWFDLSHLKVTFFDVLDILLVAFIIYQLYSLIRGTIAANIFIGLAIIWGLYYVVKVLQMRLLTDILAQFANVGILAVIIVFQQEVRRFLLLVGKNASLQRNKTTLAISSGRPRRPIGTRVNISSRISFCPAAII